QHAGDGVGDGLRCREVRAVRGAAVEPHPGRWLDRAMEELPELLAGTCYLRNMYGDVVADRGRVRPQTAEHAPAAVRLAADHAPPWRVDRHQVHGRFTCQRRAALGSRARDVVAGPVTVDTGPPPRLPHHVVLPGQPSGEQVAGAELLDLLRRL